MKTFFASVGLVTVLLGTGTTAALAGAGRTFVSGNGADTGACTHAAPCRSFAYAYTQTSAGGELVALDPAGYGPLTIAQSIIVLSESPGTASISVPQGGTGITIQAGAGAVILRGIDVLGNGGGTGLSIAGAVPVTIENCSFEVLGAGLVVSGSGMVTVTNSKFTGFGGFGINAQNMTGGFLTLDGVTIANATGAALGAGGTSAKVAINRSLLTGSRYGFTSNGSPIFVRDSQITNNNDFGFEVQDGTVVNLERVTITGNNIGASTDSSSTIYSYGDNNITGNNANAAAITKVTPD